MLEMQARAQYPPLIKTNGMRNMSNIDESHKTNSSHSWIFIQLIIILFSN